MPHLAGQQASSELCILMLLTQKKLGPTLTSIDFNSGEQNPRVLRQLCFVSIILNFKFHFYSSNLYTLCLFNLKTQF